MADTSQAAAWPKQTQLKRPLFPLGKVVATPGAMSLFEALSTSPLEYLFRHVLGDWGELDAEDRQANEAALVQLPLPMLTTLHKKLGQWADAEAAAHSASHSAGQHN